MTRKYSSISLDTTLATGIGAGDLSATVAVGTGAALLGGVTLTAGNVDQFLIAIDPDTSSEEIIAVTGRSGDTLTIVRAKAGTSAVTHLAGASVKHVFTGDDAQHFEDYAINGITETSTSTLSNKTLTAPKFVNGGFIADANGNEEIKFTTTASAVNEITVTNAATTGAPSIAATGGDTNISLNLVAKGTGTVQAGGVPLGLARLTLNNQTGTTYSLLATDLNKVVTCNNAAAITVTVPNGVFSAGDQIHIFQLGAGQVTIASDGTSVVTSAQGLKLRTQYSACTVLCTASNTFIVIGDMIV